jgi:hypothetical protein
MNAGYKRKTGFVWRAVYQPETSSTPGIIAVPNPLDAQRAALDTPLQVQRFSCWCPKLISQIGRLPETLADRCIVIRIQRKARQEECERLHNLDGETLKRQCARFVLDHEKQIVSAVPELPPSLSDRAADIWEPLLALAELAGSDWPPKAREAAVSLSASAQERNPITSLLVDIFVIFTLQGMDRLFTRALVAALNARTNRPWKEMLKGKVITDRWLAHQLRPYGILPRTFRIGEALAKGYLEEDCLETIRRYITKAELEALKAEWSASRIPAAVDTNGGTQSAGFASPPALVVKTQ